MGRSSIDGEVRPVSSKLVKVKLADLHYQYLRVVTPENIWNQDMALPTSPHVELMRLLLNDDPDQDEIRATRYFAERQRRYEIGMKQWTDDHIMEHIGRRWGILRSLKKRGYRKELHNAFPVRILAQPFWKTRFGGTPDWVDGMEIWDGGGRCAAAYALGWETIPAQMVEDVKPGSGDPGGFKDKLCSVKGIWEDK
jgi:hypothetical protein